MADSCLVKVAGNRSRLGPLLADCSCCHIKRERPSRGWESKFRLGLNSIVRMSKSGIKRKIVKTHHRLVGTRTSGVLV